MALTPALRWWDVIKVVDARQIATVLRRCYEAVIAG
jgi:hypothetical protein